MNSPSSRQKGATLVVGMIMLILISLLAVASFRLGKTDLQIVGNMQQRKQALSPAQQTVEQVISTIQFTTTPTTPLPNPSAGPSNPASAHANAPSITNTNCPIL